MFKALRKQEGFTLIELMIVVAIIGNLTLELGILTVDFSTLWALRIRVSISAIGSLILIRYSPAYQLA